MTRALQRQVIIALLLVNSFQSVAEAKPKSKKRGNPIDGAPSWVQQELVRLDARRLKDGRLLFGRRKIQGQWEPLELGPKEDLPKNIKEQLVFSVDEQGDLHCVQRVPTSSTGDSVTIVKHCFYPDGRLFFFKVYHAAFHGKCHDEAQSAKEFLVAFFDKNSVWPAWSKHTFFDFSMERLRSGCVPTVKNRKPDWQNANEVPFWPQFG